MSKITSALQIMPQEIYKESDTQKTDLGALARTPDGRAFRYVKAGGTALVAGKLQQGPDITAYHQNVAVAAAAAIGATQVTVTLGATAATAGQYANGYLIVNDETGEGQTYQIKSNPAADASASLVVTLYDEDALVTALTTSSEVCLIPNLYNGVIVNPTTPTNAPVGVAVYPITASYYGWVQVYGVVSCLNDSNTTVGLAIAPSQSVAGSVKTGATTLDSIGTALQAGVDTEYRTVFLRIG